MSFSVDFTAKVVVVVGGTSGINRGIALAFARAGAKVAVASRSQAKVDDTVAALGANGFGFVADVRDYPALANGLKQAHERFGDFDVVVSGAAGNFPARAHEMSPNGFKSVVDIDLLGTYHVCRAAYPLLSRPGACVINISAPQAQIAMVSQAHVCAAKAGVDMITKTLALEWGPEGIRVNGVVPGPIDGTEGMARLAPSESARERCRQSVPLRRLGKAEDVANACLFLASPAGAFISGAVLPVDGGWLAGGAAALASGVDAASLSGLS